MRTSSSDLLWHYTSIDTMVKICTNLNMRATHHAFLNDRAEIQLGKKYIEERIPKLLKTSDDKERFSLVMQKINKLLDGSVLSRYFIISLSRQYDFLPQWRGYTPQSGGCAIGFYTNLLSKAFLQTFENDNSFSFGMPDTVCCNYLYDADTFSDTIQTLVDLLRKIPGQEFSVNTDGLENKNLQFFLFKMLSFIFSLKHRCFQDEREVRMLFDLNNVTDAIKFENMKPYIEISIRPEYFPQLIGEVMVSPHGDKEKNLQYVRFFSKTLGKKYKTTNQDGLLFPVTESHLPYRG